MATFWLWYFVVKLGYYFPLGISFFIISYFGQNAHPQYIITDVGNCYF